MPSHCVRCGRRVSHAGFCKDCRPPNAPNRGKEYYDHGGGKENKHERYHEGGGKENKHELYHEGGGQEKKLELYHSEEATAEREVKAAELKESRRDEAEAFMAENGMLGIDSKFAREKKVEHIRSDKTLLHKLTGDPRLIGISIEDLHKNPDVCIYFGETFRKLREEDLRWLSTRGALGGGTNRPTLEWSVPRGERTHITMSEAREELGFKSCVLHEDFLKVNTTAIEDLLQRKCHDLGLPRRLHRRVGAGSKGFKRYFSDDEEEEDEDGRPTKLHKVFMAYSFGAMPAIDKGDVVVCE